MISKTHHVLLLIESSRAYGRGCLMGVAGYMRTHGFWDVVHIERGLAEAIQFIRAYACEGIGVPEVCAATAISRATLERRFRSLLGRSPREEIERVRIDRARILLVETDYSLDRIAGMTAYKTAAHLITAFRRHTEGTPAKYRANNRFFADKRAVD